MDQNVSDDGDDQADGERAEQSGRFGTEPCVSEEPTEQHAERGENEERAGESNQAAGGDKGDVFAEQ